MRDYTKLQAFQLADRLAISVYRTTKAFPREELFGLTSQLRRAAVSTASNIVEGCARQTQTDYLHFLTIAFGSLREMQYQLSLAVRLNYISTDTHTNVDRLCTECSKVLGALIRSLRPSRPDRKPWAGSKGLTAAAPNSLTV